MEAQPVPPPETQTPNRPTYDVAFFQIVEKFTAEALAQVPELHGIALVPLWVNQPENAPAGVLRLRDATPPYMASLIKLLARLAAFNGDVHRDLIGQIKMFDNYAAQLAETIKDRVAVLENLPQQNNAPTNE
jgi:hypothetical protein